MSDLKEQIPPAPCPYPQAQPEAPVPVMPDLPAAPLASEDEAMVLAWVQAAQQGDRAAMERLLQHFQNRVWRRARYRIGDPEEAWDVAQEVFLICFRKLGQFRGESHFWTWLARIVDNQVKNRQGWWRHRRKDLTYSIHDLWRSNDDQDNTEWDPPDPSPSPRQEAAGREVLEALEETLVDLSPEHREIIMLRFADGLSYEEIAETLGISLGTVKSRINRARHDLREKMEKFL